MQHCFRLMLFVCVCLALGDASRCRAQRDHPAETIDHLRTAWAQALEQHDLEASVAFFQSDALFITPGGERYPDRAAIRTLYRSVMDTYRSQISLVNNRLQVADTLAVDDGAYTETLTEIATGKRLPLHGSYVCVWHRQPDRSWKISEMVWTSR